MAKNQRTLLRRIFPTAHKILLNRLVEVRLRNAVGDALVIGAGKEPYRQMMPNVASLICTDVEDGDEIDQIVDAHSLPFRSSSFNCVIVIEVFEHLRDPSLASIEMRRVLREGGSAYVTIPFMFRVHGDPFDFQRLTKSGLEELFRDFSSVEVIPFGNRAHVISDILSTTTRSAVVLRILNHLISLAAFSKPSSDCPSGYAVELRK